MIKYLSLFILLFSSNIFFSQKVNPIIFIELGTGYANDFTNKGGLNQFGELNFETNKILFSVRFSELYQFGLDILLITPITPIPVIALEVEYNEIAFLYGRRYTKNNFAYSFSGGISTNKYIQGFKNENNEWFQEKKNFIGFPFEFNVKWFKNNKSKYKIYEIIPVGKETGLGNSIGFKLLGNISQHSFIGVGIVMGIGYHKEY